MKALTSIIALLCATSWLGTALAQMPMPNVKPEKTVRIAAKKIEWLKKKPNTRANYYIYLMSASWCGPCRGLMPKVVEAYKNEMEEGKKVEIILLGFDQTDEAVLNYMKKYDVEFAALRVGSPECFRLPGFDFADHKRGIPFVYICDYKGNVLAKGGAGVFHNRHEVIKEGKPGKKAPKKRTKKSKKRD